MIDSVAIRIQDATFPLENIAELHPFTGGVWGSFNGLHVAQHETGNVTVKGSLPKYANGENVTPLTRLGLKDTLSRLEAETGLDLHAGTIFRLETGFTFPVKYPPRDYLALWQKFGRYQKSTWGDGTSVQLGLKSKARLFLGYDKGAEIEPDSLPVGFPAEYALRLELKYITGVKKIFKKTLSPWDLCSKDVYDGLLNRFRDFYFTIPKTREVCTLENQRFTGARFRDAMAIIGLQSYGYDRALLDVTEARRRGEIDKKTAQRIRGVICDLGADERLSMTKDITKELDDHVRAL